jgi:hypothetical protein
VSCFKICSPPFFVLSIEFFTIGQGRPSNRIHQQFFRWVPNDARRAAQNKVDIVKRIDAGADPDIFDFFFGFGGFGNPFLADIVSAGWLPRAFFEAVGGPGGGRGILAFSVTF